MLCEEFHLGSKIIPRYICKLSAYGFACVCMYVNTAKIRHAVKDIIFNSIIINSNSVSNHTIDRH